MPKIIVYLLLIFIAGSAIKRAYAAENTDFDLSRSLRIDFILSGTKKQQHAGLLRLKEEKYWSSPDQNLISPFDYGTYRIDVYNTDSQLIYRRGFSTLFEEWQITALPQNGPAAFEQSLNIPFPENPVIVRISVREKGQFKGISEWKINPADPAIIKIEPPYEAALIFGKKTYKNRLDLVFLADGYTRDDQKKAHKDAKTFARFLFKQAPFNEYRKYINIWLVHPPSRERGADEPCQDIYRHTALGSSFNTLGLKRYLSTPRYFDVKNTAAASPYDFLFVMVNTKRYGGGGIFNHFSVFASGSQSAKKVFVHELGHYFAGLADEYFNSKVTYQDLRDTTLEPWQPNITTLVDFDSKWKIMVDKSTPVPTPRTNKYNQTTGVFRGGAYMAAGVYSPATDCRMKSNKAKSFCAVCQRAIRQMLEWYIVKEQ